MARGPAEEGAAPAVDGTVRGKRENYFNEKEAHSLKQTGKKQQKPLVGGMTLVPVTGPTADSSPDFKTSPL